MGEIVQKTGKYNLIRRHSILVSGNFLCDFIPLWLKLSFLGQSLLILMVCGFLRNKGLLYLFFSHILTIRSSTLGIKAKIALHLASNAEVLVLSPS